MEPFEGLHDQVGGPQLYTITRWTERLPWLSVGFSSRIGGVSKGNWDSLNCGLHVADHPDDVVHNRRLIAEALGFTLNEWTCAEQVHGVEVQSVLHIDAGKGSLSRETAIPDTDALITQDSGVWLTAFFADCVPIYMVDPDRRVIALVHAGWRGTAGGIARLAVEAFQERHGSEPSQLMAAIGPSIGGCCYEVDHHVIDKLQPVLDRKDHAESIITPAPNGKYKLNLKELNRQIMIKAGILPTRIECSNWCTSCRTDLFYSHRREQGQTGRMIAWIGRKR